MAKINVNIKSFYDYTLDAYKKDLEDYSPRWCVYYGGAGSGKSRHVVVKIILKALKDKRKILVVRKVGTTLRDSVFAEFKEVINDFNLFKVCKINKSDMTIDFPNKSTILFKGLDDREKIKSISGITDIVIEECTEINSNDFEQLDLRLRSKSKYNQIHLMFNPISKNNWVYRYFGFDGTPKPRRTKIIKTTYKDNYMLPLDYVRSLEEKINTNPAYFKIYALGEFCTLEKTIFTNYKVKDFNEFDLRATELRNFFEENNLDIEITNDILRNPLYRNLVNNKKMCIGLDFGYNDPTAIVKCYVDLKQKKLYIYDEVYEQYLTNKDISSILKNKKWHKNKICCDSANPKDIQDLKEMGITKVYPARKGKDSIMNGIRFLQMFEIIIHPRCTNFLMEIEAYTWLKDKFTDSYIDKPDPNCDEHLIDALRYAVESIRIKSNMTIKNFNF